MSDNKDFPWYDHFEKMLPYRMKAGYSGAWNLYIKAMIAQTLEQLIAESFLFRQTKHPNSPDDALNVVGSENGLIRGSSESDDDYRNRINTRDGILPYYGQEDTLLSTLNSLGYSGLTYSIINDLPGRDGSLYSPKTNEEIVGYASSVSHPSQFIVYVEATTILGSETESDIVTDEQLNTIRAIIRKMKPAQWVCREVVIVYPGTLLAYDGSEVYDGVGLTYLDGDALPPSFIFEVHKGQV
jgi:hypothetical protein